LTSPYTFYRINYDKIEGKPDIPNTIITGAKLFPFDDSFSVHQLNSAIQSVVSSGALGANFIGSVLQVGEISIKQQEALASSMTTPDGMYR